ncbi:hypothetical protein [Rothia sp. ZJ932]|uniref:hypothetical protein n=1 Tax=Rothia sp. ZJ932 TaxID=2810516 RepID=UPI0019673B8B|nr:hypothetical protein [Rothia sp. ZJ932]QRZ61331.1 hypothetical protein JR346_08865 [Rothia sp. ZJ932]
MRKPFALCVSALFLLSACTPGNVQISDKSPEEQLKDSSFVVYAAGDYHAADGLENNPGSSVLFYDSEAREWSDIATEGLNKADFNFDGERLYYRDQSNDYILDSNGLKTIEHGYELTPHIMLSFSLPITEGGSVALDNVGFIDEKGSGYEWKIIVNEGETRKVFRLPHNLEYAAQCEDGSIWGKTTPYLSSTNSGYGAAESPAQYLSLYPDFKTEPVGDFKYNKLHSDDNDLVCKDKKLYHIVDNFKSEITSPMGGGPQDYEGSSLVSYDIGTGEFFEKEITGDWSTRINDEMWNPAFISKYVYKNDLWWVSGSGDVIKTDLETAHNTKMFELADYDASSDPGFLEFKDNYLFQIKFWKGKDADIYRFNLDTGELEKHSTIPDFVEVEKRNQFPAAVEITDLEKMLNL